MDVNLNAHVGPGDTVIVPKYQDFYVNGEVKSPGSFTYGPQLNIQKAIAIAGGFTDRASHNKVKLLRNNEHDSKYKEADEVDLNTAVGPGDVIVVEESFF